MPMDADRASGCERCCNLPVLWDFVFDAYRSRVLVVSALLGALASLAGRVLFLIEPCAVGLSQLDETVISASSDLLWLALALAADILQALFVVVTLLSSSRWQSVWWLLPALAIGILYFVVLTLVEGTYCFRLAEYGDAFVIQPEEDQGDGVAWGFLSALPVTARTIAVFRLLQWANVLLACVVLLALITRRFLLLTLERRGRSAKLPRAFVPHVVATYLHLIAIEAETPGAWQAARWMATRFALVPLRHWLAVTTAAISLLLLQLSVDGLVGGLASSDIDFIATIGASGQALQACVTAFGGASMLLSLWFISGDVLLLVEAHPAALAPYYLAAEEMAEEEKELLLDSGSCRGQLQLQMPIRAAGGFAKAPGYLEHAASSTPPPLVRGAVAAAAWLLRLAGGSSGRAEAPPRLLDLAAFQYTDAAGYILMYVTSLLAVSFVLWILCAAVGLLVSLPLLRSYFLTYLASMAGSVVYRYAATRCLRRCCTRGSRLLLPRAFMWTDAALSMFVSALFSVSLGLTRVALSVLWALLAASQLSRSTLPDGVASFDSGWQMYGATLKCSLTWAIDPESVPAPGVISD